MNMREIMNQINETSEIMVQLVISGDQPMVLPLSEFLSVNEFEPEEEADIRDALQSGSVYHGGGGAAAEWTVELA